jgi:hypothetical protein
MSQTVARNAFVSLAQKYGSHPAVCGFVISNEQNSDLVRGAWQFWKWFDTTAGLVKQQAPSKLTSMTIVDDAMLSVINAEAYGLDHLEVWGINSYRGTRTTGFDTLFTSFAQYSNRPLIIGEYGPPASTRNEAGQVVEMANAAEAQADYIEVHWLDIEANRDVCSGGLVFEWTDEWWKHAVPATHDATPAPNGAYPGGWGDEEWFGLHAVAMARADADPAAYATRGADVLKPRAAVATLTALFTRALGPAPPQAPPTPITLIPIAPIAPLAPTAQPQNAPVEPVAPTSAPLDAPLNAPLAVPRPAATPTSAPSLSPSLPTPASTPPTAPSATPRSPALTSTPSLASPQQALSFLAIAFVVGIGLLNL